jgi:hypothetical protein
MSSPNAPTTEIITQSLSPEPPLWPISYADLQGSKRSDIVPNRLATNIGPLLGVPYPEEPHGDTCWVGDYPQLTLTEIGQGFPRDARVKSLAGQRLCHPKSYPCSGKYLLRACAARY